MMIRPVLLWTDALVLVLVLAILAAAVSIHHREHLRSPWLKVTRSAYGMCALLVLSVFVAVGLLDCIHFRTALPTTGHTGKVNYDVKVSSALDALVDPLGSHSERTYSAPFGAYSFAKENLRRADGTTVRDYPRLRYGGSHLKDPPGQLADDVAKRTLGAAGLALIIWVALSFLVACGLARSQRQGLAAALRGLRNGDTDIPWRAMLGTVGLMLVVLTPLVVLSDSYHVFGTDKVGHDVFFMVLKSIRTGLVIGTLTTLVMLPFAVALGIMAGYYRGWVDDLIQYLYTTVSSIPSVLLIAAAVLLSQVWMDQHPELFETVTERADVRLLFLCMILGLTSWTHLCRLLRGEALKLRELDFIQAAHAFGVSNWRILLRHILPNVLHIVMISVVMEFSGLVLAEAVLSYVGVGVDPSMISFGTMINNARLEMAREPMVWWSLAAAFVFMFVLVLAANLFADAVRDAFDPRFQSPLRRRRAPTATDHA